MNPLQILHDLLVRIWQSVLDALNLAVSAVLAALNPLLWIQVAANLVVPLLPVPAGSTLADAILNAGHWLASVVVYISWLDYFVDLSYFMVVVSIIVSIEFAIAWFRLWRMIRSIIF